MRFWLLLPGREVEVMVLIAYFSISGGRLVYDDVWK